MITTNTNMAFRGVRYTKAGKDFIKNLPEDVQKTLALAEYCMLDNKYTNLIVNKNGYAVQYQNEKGKHCCKIKNAHYNWKRDIVEYQIKDKNQDKFVFNLKQEPELAKRISKCIREAKYDKSGVGVLRINISLIDLLERQAKNLLHKPNIFEKLINKIKK